MRLSVRKYRIIAIVAAMVLIISAVGFAYAASDGKGVASGEYDKNYTVTKVKSVTSGAAVIGAVLQILDSNGTVVEEWTTTNADHEINAFLTAGKSYILRETKAPAGHTVSADITFKVSSDGSEDTVTMYEDYTKVKIKKVAK